MHLKVNTIKKLTVMLNDELDERFREAVFKKKGLRRGNLTAAVQEALEKWVEETDEPEATE